MVVSASFAEEPAATFPQDVASYIERRNLCDHFRGEDPYDEERRAFLEKNILELCTGTDRQLAALKQKYSSNCAIMAKLEQYEPEIEPREQQ